MKPGDLVRIKEDVIGPHEYKDYRGIPYLCLEYHVPPWEDENNPPTHMKLLLRNGRICGFFMGHLEVIGETG